MTHDRTGEGIPLDTTPIHLAADSSSLVIHGFTFEGPAFEAYIAAHTSPDDAGRLMFVEQSVTHWPSWERHPAGDELVVLLSGVALFEQEIDGEVVRTRVTPGQAVRNPAGVWHTADVEEPFAAIYITPCPGTEHRPRERA